MTSGQLKVVSKNSEKFRFCGTARGHQFHCDIPTEMGGEDAAMLPPEGLLASLGNCLGMVIALTCAQKEIPYEGLEVTVTADIVEEGKRLDNFRAEVKMPQELDARQRKIVESAFALCKVGHTLAHGATVEEVLL
jgi:uncharacterized OsmC-like protein